MSEKFFSIKQNGLGDYREKGSKFLGFSFPVKNDYEVKEYISALRKEYYDARHYCYAYRLGTESLYERANDDGEPGHSAGDPILGQIKSHNLTNCLVVVVRYFGGTKLGVPGLVHAYKSAASEALSTAVKFEVIPKLELTLTFAYDQLGTVEKWMIDFECDVIDRDFKEGCRITFMLKKALQADFNFVCRNFYMIKLLSNED